MQKFVDLLDALADQAGSDRKAATLLGVSQNAVSQWRRRHAFPDDDQAERIAAALKLDAAHVYVIVRIARAKSQTSRATWQRVAQAFGKAATVAVLAIGAAGAPSPAPAQGDSGGGVRTLCIMSTRRRPSALAQALAQISRFLGLAPRRFA